MEIQDIVELAKRVVMETGDHPPQFVLEKDDVAMLIAVPQYDNSQRELLINTLRAKIEEEHVEKYWAIFSAWIVDSKKSDEHVMAKLKELVKKKVLTAKQAKEFAPSLKKAIVESIRPSQHPLRTEVLIISEFDKKKGMFALAYKYSVAKKGVKIVKKPLRLDGTMYSAWNVWSPQQVDLNDAGELL